ncbi:inositol-trisphosphate 3-kinase homolog isoform X2 [Hermetia illucens]|uniref:inositol-trisphosphate 3-kinase homolog isoform X2 n=1 Tax=Hermetia illucens TaxID=343691 RepID=UPI0018CC07A3|nr:inositol-trisphosphate 3-kinase homolog isoform X2 [Hermetia illucens]
MVHKNFGYSKVNLRWCQWKSFAVNIVVESENLADFLSNRDLLLPNKMSLLKFLAINALELSAPAAPVLLQHGSTKTNGWVQLAGHPESIVPAAAGVVRKRVSGPVDSEVKAYRQIAQDACAAKLVPKFLGVQEMKGETYIELQDLLHGFKEPSVMDIKMGCRTFSESEVMNTTLRPDLYKKMVAVDSTAPTEEEHRQQAITKLRYMLFREQMSSSQSKGFRIEALRLGNNDPVTDLKTVRTASQIQGTISHFLNNRRTTTKDIIKRLKTMRSLMEKSEFFRTHEIVGSSIFIVYDEEKIGAWLIDFAKARRLPEGVSITHRKPWIPGNCEEGLLHGMDELIQVFENVYESQTKTDLRKCSRR